MRVAEDARYGVAASVDEQAGTITLRATDGYLRRTVTGGGAMDANVGDWMTRTPLSIGPDELASEALRQMQNRSVTMLLVLDDRRLAGVIHMHDVLRVGIA